MATFYVQIPDDDVKPLPGETWEQAVARTIVEQRLVLSEAPADDDDTAG